MIWFKAPITCGSGAHSRIAGRFAQLLSRALAESGAGGVGLAEDPQWAQGTATCPHPQIIVMLTEKCREQQRSKVEAERLRVLQSNLEQSLLQLQQDKEALRCGASGGGRREPIPVGPHNTGR